MAPAADTTRPVVTRFSSSRRSFRAGSGRRRGTTLRFTLSEAARVRIRITGPRARVRGTLTRAARAGANSIAFSGRFGRRRLSPARYTATITATDAAGNVSRAVTLRFRVIS